MGEAARRRATYEDLLRVPDTMVAEILDGELYATPRPAVPHAQAASVLGMDLGGAFQRGRGGPGGWWIVDEPELHLDDEILVPDLAGWRRERLPALPHAPYMTLAPDWICEVISDSTRSLDRVRKLPTFARFAVRHAWLVDPLARTLEVFRLEQGRWVLVGTYEGEAEVRAEPFDEVPLSLGALWVPEQPPRGSDQAG